MVRNDNTAVLLFAYNYDTKMRIPIVNKCKQMLITDKLQ